MQAPTTDKTKDCGSITATKILGNEGEEAACRYLMLAGYTIRARNVRAGRRGEIDIIAVDHAEGMIVFVEVKTRTSHSSDYPIHSAMNPRKRRALRRAIASWTVRHGYEGPGRIDLLSVHCGMVVEHIQNIGSDFY